MTRVPGNATHSSIRHRARTNACSETFALRTAARMRTQAISLARSLCGSKKPSLSIASNACCARAAEPRSASIRGTTSIAIGVSGISFFARRLATRARRGHQYRRTAARMSPKSRFQDQPGPSVRLVQPVAVVVGAGLQDAGVTGQMRLELFAASISQVIEDRLRPHSVGKMPVVADVLSKRSVWLCLAPAWVR